MIQPAAVVWLLVVVAASFTGVGWVLARRGRERTRRASRPRGPFLLGVLCGVVAGPVLRRRSRHLRALRATIRRADRFAARVLPIAASDAPRLSWSRLGRVPSGRR